MGLDGCIGRAPRPPEWIKDGVTDEGEHADEPESEFLGERRGMALNPHLPGDVRPDLAEPPGVVVSVDDAQRPLLWCGGPVRTGLTEHEDVLDIVLDHCIRLVRLPEESRPVSLDLGGGVGNLVPEYWAQVVEADLDAVLGKIGVEGNHAVAPGFPSGETHITYDDAEAPTRNNQLEASRPDAPESGEEFPIIR